MTGTLAPLTTPLDALLEELEDPRVEKRLEAVGALARFAAAAMVPPLRRAAAMDPSGEVRGLAEKLADQVISAHPEMEPPPPPPPPPALPNARDMLASPDPHVRAQASRSLIAHPDPEAAPLLAPLVRVEQDRFLLGSLMLGLAACGRGKHAEAIDEHLASADARTRSNAIEALEATGDPGVIPRIMPFLHDPNHRVRGAAASAVRPFHPEPAIQVLDAMLADEEHVVVRAALFSLRFFDGPTALPRLRPLLLDGDRDERRMARESLKFMAVRGSAGARAVLALDPDPDPAPAEAAPAPAPAPAGAAPELVLPADLGEIRELLRATRATARARGLAGLLAGGFGARFELLQDLARSEVHPHLYEPAAAALAQAAGARAVETLERIGNELTEGAKRSHLKALARQLADPQTAAALDVAIEPASLCSRLHALPEAERAPDALRRAIKNHTGAADALFLFDLALEQRLPEAYDLAMGLALNKDRKLRLAAIEVLGEIKSRDAAETLAGLVRDPDADVSLAALVRLAAFDPMAARDAASELLATGEALTMRRARVMLAKLGDAGKRPEPDADELRRLSGGLLAPGLTPRQDRGAPSIRMVAAVAMLVLLVGWIAVLWLR